MAVTIKGIRIESLSLQRDTEEGGVKLASATYSLISSVDTVLAKQAIGGYNSDIKLEPSADTLKALRDFTRLYQQDVTRTLGLEE